MEDRQLLVDTFRRIEALEDAVVLLAKVVDEIKQSIVKHLAGQ